MHFLLKIKNYFFYTFTFILFITCARQQPLGGGPKDEAPPVCIATYPQEEANTNFKGKYVELKFDKAIEVRNLHKELIITPKLKKIKNKPPYTEKKKKKSIRIYFNSPLESNTTYTLNFRNAISSITEKKKSLQPTIVFSTGDTINTLYIQGNVSYLMNQKKVNKALVSIYRVADEKKYTCKACKENPDYFTYTDEKGNFTLSNLQEGKYKIYAGKNQENRLTINTTKDFYGFKKEIIYLKKNETPNNISIAIYKGNIEPLKIQYARPMGNYFEIAFSKPIIDYKITVQKKKKKNDVYSILSNDKKKIILYNTMQLLDDQLLPITLQAEDSICQKIEKNIDIQFKWRKKQKKNLGVVLETKIGTLENPFFEAKLTFDCPIKKINPTKISWQFEKNPVPISLSKDEITLNKKKNIVTIHTKLNTQPLKILEKWSEKKHRFKFFVEKETFESIEGNKNKAGEANCIISPKNYLGTIEGKIQTHFSHFIIQLLNKRYQIVEEIRNKKSYIFKNIDPGEYYIRVLIVNSGAKKWSFGNMTKNISPNPVFFYKDPITVKANWEKKETNITC